MAGRVDRIEFTYLPDPAVAVQALIRGEMDVIQFPPNDLVPLMRKSPNVKVEITNKLGRLAILRPNHLVAPMDNPKVRQAMLYAIDQTQHLNAVVGVPEQEIVCWTARQFGSEHGRGAVYFPAFRRPKQIPALPDFHCFQRAAPASGAAPPGP